MQETGTFPAGQSWRSGRPLVSRTRLSPPLSGGLRPSACSSVATILTKVQRGKATLETLRQRTQSYRPGRRAIELTQLAAEGAVPADLELDLLHRRYARTDTVVVLLLGWFPQLGLRSLSPALTFTPALGRHFEMRRKRTRLLRTLVRLFSAGGCQASRFSGHHEKIASLAFVLLNVGGEAAFPKIDQPARPYATSTAPQKAADLRWESQGQ